MGLIGLGQTSSGRLQVRLLSRTPCFSSLTVWTGWFQSSMNLHAHISFFHLLCRSVFCFSFFCFWFYPSLMRSTLSAVQVDFSLHAHVSFSCTLLCHSAFASHFPATDSILHWSNLSAVQIRRNWIPLRCRCRLKKLVVHQHSFHVMWKMPWRILRGPHYLCLVCVTWMTG